ncbi:amino acid ABC transporter membrane protein (PAAT family) [Leucobacter komagatae]|uniref:Amino acid ABC transporter membrane protein (PAAT family) n=1 Tax=Leucobacter komagatae TaxID=55969 RepID=A0A542Y8B6_9MICO|nr:amino acid ABC transporter permease [Leucobacter komagatae]TQL44332.1 amino acid ABC transporter membrane protein (PAAT family) [Leucobacter komagatae]
MSHPVSDAEERHAEPEAIRAIRRKHPWRVIFAVLLVLIAGVFIYDAAFNRPVFAWPEVGKYLFDTRIIGAIGYTLQLTVYSMVIAIVLGVLLAVMRQSPNPVVKAVSWVYLWIFRGTPVYVQLTFWGLVPVIYKTVSLGIPFTEAVVTFTTKDLLSYYTLAIIGLALNEAAYMAEIVRAGLLAVDKGQDEAATALGLGWWHTMTRVVLPQAMRVIIPPTGNEVISMLKTTSLVAAVPFIGELFTRQRDIAAVTYQPVPMLIVASVWYLVITSILMVGQYYLEKHFAKGIGQRPDVQRPSVATETITVVGELDTEYPTYTEADGRTSIVPPHSGTGGGGR